MNFEQIQVYLQNKKKFVNKIDFWRTIETNHTPMKTTLSHLPKTQTRRILKALTQIILEKVPTEMIILFGSYARGDWVEDYQEKYEYVSDFDILIVTKDRHTAKQGKSRGSWKRN